MKCSRARIFWVGKNRSAIIPTKNGAMIAPIAMLP